ncbi:MAG: TrkA family potassium uptake protein [Lachnospiraceae bacterium]|jgi:trk system potassium uptake protein TrkA|nr:TrkA family potassium uptake protein [Lachnospiraceae bacterium]
MKTILIIGLGRFGRHVARRLHEIGHQIMAVDNKEERVEAAMPYVTNALVGDGTRHDFIASLGVRDYDLCIVAIGDNFQSSLETTSLLKELGAKKVVARASRDVHAKFLLRNGADDVVYPEKQVAEWTAERYSSDLLFDYFSMGDGYAVMEIEIPSTWVGKKISDLDLRKRYNINILATKRDSKINMQISPNLELTGKETLLVLGKDDEIQKCLNA